MIYEQGILNRTALLLGAENMERLARARVIIFGVGGVGSWCAEGLVRSGVKHLTLVDSDRICVTNINRQAMALCSTVGQVKVEALKQRLLDINPSAGIVAVQKIYSKDTAHEFDLAAYDCIVDAIDSIGSKMHLILEATRTDATFFSSMGAALKVDPTRIRVAEFWDVRGCPLGSILRKRIKKLGFPSKKFQCVYSDEVLENRGANSACGSERCLCPRDGDCEGDPALANHEWCSLKAQINGTTAPVVAMFGFTLASLIVRSIIEN